MRKISRSGVGGSVRRYIGREIQRCGDLASPNSSGLHVTAGKAMGLRCLRSLERHAADDESVGLLSEDSRLAFLGLVKTIDFADSRIIFDGGESFVGQSDGISFDILKQMLGEGLLWTGQDFDSDD